MSFGASRVGIDTAGGLIVEALNENVFIEGFFPALLGCHVQDHGDNPHDNAYMVECSPNVFVGSIGLCRALNAASCGDVATGSSNVLVD